MSRMRVEDERHEELLEVLHRINDSLEVLREQAQDARRFRDELRGVLNRARRWLS